MPKCSASGSYNANEPGYYDETESVADPQPTESAVVEETTTADVPAVTEDAVPAEVPSEVPVQTEQPASVPAPSLFEPVANPKRVVLPRLD